MLTVCSKQFAVLECHIGPSVHTFDDRQYRGSRRSDSRFDAGRCGIGDASTAI